MSIFYLAQAPATAPASTTAAAPAVTAATPAATATTSTPSQPENKPQGTDAQQPAGIASWLSNPMFMMVIIAVLFWVMLIRPQRKAQKEQQARINALVRGDSVITNAGIHGFVEKVNDTTISLKIAEGVVIELEKAAVVQVLK